MLWGYVFGVVVASSALSYSTLYKTQAERNRLAVSFGSNKASAALFGPAPDLQTVAGFTVFKTFLTLTIVGAVWGLMTSSRLLRGEEDAGRWELLLAGQTTRRRATVQTLAGLLAGLTTLWALTAVIISVSGRSSKVDIAVGPALYFALCLVAGAVMFTAVGALTSQLSSTRRQAAGYAASILGVSYALRMVADSGIGLHWLIWLSPLGWVEELQPLTSPRPIALLPVVALTAVLAVVAVHLADARDLGASALPDRSSSKSHLGLLSGPTGLAFRTMRPGIIGWLTAVAITSAVMGLVAKQAGATFSQSSLQKVFSKLGAEGSGTDTFLGVALLIVAVLVAFIAVGQITRARAEESEGRLDNILVRPVSRVSWLFGRLGMAISVLVASGLSAGLFTWLASASQHSGVSPATLLDAGLNVVPPAILVLGTGALVFGVLPRAAPIATYCVVGWSLLIELVGGIGALSHWILDTSVFHQMASAPATAPNWEVNFVMIGIGALGSLIGASALVHRDVQGE